MHDAGPEDPGNGDFDSDDIAPTSEEATYTDGGSGTREERMQFESLDPRVMYHDDMNEVLIASQDASIHANKAFIFLGTVIESDELNIEGNRYEEPVGLRVRVDRVYSGDAFAEGDVPSVFFPISRYVDAMGRTVQAGPRMEEGRSYVFFCDLAQDSLVQDWLDDRYPTSPGLADSFDLVVSWDAYCFPVKDGLVCAWTGNGWNDGSAQNADMPYLKRKEFTEGLFYAIGEGTPEPPDSLFFKTEDFTSAIEEARGMQPSDEIGLQRIMVYSTSEL